MFCPSVILSAYRTLLLLLIPRFCSRLFKVVVGFLTQCIFRVQNLLQLHVHVVLFSLTVSLYLGAQGEVCLGASIAALLQRVPGPRPVSDLNGSRNRGLSSSGSTGWKMWVVHLPSGCALLGAKWKFHPLLDLWP